MVTDVRSTLRKVLTNLHSEKTRVAQQISAIETALGALDGRRQPNGSPRRRRTMSAATRKAISKRVKAYWAKRKKKTTPGGTK